MKRTHQRPSRSVWLPAMQAGAGCVVLVILLALLNACGDGSPTAADPASEASSDTAIRTQSAARAVAGAVALAAAQDEDVLLGGAHSGSLRVIVTAANEGRLRLEFAAYSDDGVSFLYGTLTVTWAAGGHPVFGGDLEIRTGDGDAEAVGLEGDLIHLPGGGSMSIVIDWPDSPTLPGENPPDENRPDSGSPGETPPDEQGEPSDAIDADVSPSTIRLTPAGREAIWDAVLVAAAQGPGAHAGLVSGHLRVGHSHTTQVSAAGLVEDSEISLQFEHYAVTTRYALSGNLLLRHRQDSQGRQRSAAEGELIVYTRTGVGVFRPTSEMVRDGFSTHRLDVDRADDVAWADGKG